jgi:Ser/Thr protein kinase RdoA (MazF antagonist)
MTGEPTGAGWNGGAHPGKLRAMTSPRKDAAVVLGRSVGSGKDADVFESGEAVVKLFKPGVPKHTAFREAASLAQVEAHGLPVPVVRGVHQIDGRWGIVMSRVEGPPFAESALAHPGDIPALLKAMVLLHARIHACQPVFLGSMKARLLTNIRRAALLDEGQQSELLAELARLPDGDRLCHGDFHPWNVLGTIDRPSIIDWTSASKGSPAADVCRSYVLMNPSVPALAQAYVEAYAELSGESIDEIFKWLRVVAAARLGEGVADEADGLLAMVAARHPER